MLLLHMSVGQARRFLREHYDDAHDLYYHYVLDGVDPALPEAGPFMAAAQGRLVGILSVREFILSDPAVELEAIMDKEVLTATPETDKEEVARVLARYNLLAVPIVDGDNHL